MAVSPVSARQPGPEYFPALTGLRFFLALWVILHHLAGKGMMLDPSRQSFPAWLASFFDQGHLAVRTFFVLSGFVLAQGYRSSKWTRQDLTAYAVARIARVYPVYLLSLLLVSYFILQFLLSPASDAGGKIGALTAYGFVLQGWMPQAGAGWNTPAWSLSCEFFFYLFLPVLLIWLKDSRVKVAILFVMALLLPILLRRGGLMLPWKPVLHVADFLMGIAAAWLYLALKRRLRHGYFIYISAVGLGATAIVCSIPDHGAMLRVANGMLLLGLAIGGGSLAGFLSSGAAQYLGKASYSLYILHVPFLWWFGNRGPAMLGNAPITATAIYLVSITLLAIASYEWIEKPANGWIRAKTKMRPIALQ